MTQQLEWKKRNLRAVQEAFLKATENKNIRVLSEPERFAELHKAEDLAERALEATKQIEHKQPEMIVRPNVLRKADHSEEQNREVPVSISRREEITQEEFLTDLAKRIGDENVVRTHGKPVFLTDRDRYQYLLNQFYCGERLSREDMDFKFAYEAKMTKAEENYFDSYVKDKFSN